MGDELSQLQVNVVRNIVFIIKHHGFQEIVFDHEEFGILPAETSGLKQIKQINTVNREKITDFNSTIHYLE